MANDTDLHNHRIGDQRRAEAPAAPAIVPLTELGVIAVDGTDAVAFLQTQLTNDVGRLGDDALQLNGYCTVKGRLLATFHQWREQDAVLLRLPRDILPSVLKRLSMFVLRSKVKLSDASDRWMTYGVLGPGLAERAGSTGASLPAAPWTSVRAGAARIARLPDADGIERFLVTTPADAALPAWCDALPRAPASRWWWSEIAAAIPTVFAATQEKFVPQMINFEVLGGVDFKKGCYPGQEIVARSQYLGKLKRRMQRGHVPVADVVAGADVYHSASPQPVGTVVMAAPSPSPAVAGGSALLFEVPLDRLDAGTLHVAGANGPTLSVLPLPYQLFDPTA